MVVEEQTLHGSSKLREKGHRSSRGTARWLHLREETLITGASVSCYGGKYFIFVRVDVCGIAFKESDKGFLSGLSCPFGNVNVDIVESRGGMGVVNRGYGRTCRWVRAVDPLLKGMATLHFAAASREAGLVSVWRGAH